MGEKGWARVSDHPFMLTDAEVLAGMGGERVWWCEELAPPLWDRDECRRIQMQDMSIHLSCGWVWVVKEADDG